MYPRFQSNQAATHAASDYLTDMMSFEANAGHIPIVVGPLHFIDIPQKSPQCFLGTCNVRSPGDDINFSTFITFQNNYTVRISLCPG